MRYATHCFYSDNFDGPAGPLGANWVDDGWGKRGGVAISKIRGGTALYNGDVPADNDIYVVTYIYPNMPYGWLNPTNVKLGVIFGAYKAWVAFNNHPNCGPIWPTLYGSINLSGPGVAKQVSLGMCRHAGLLEVDVRYSTKRIIVYWNGVPWIDETLPSLGLLSPCGMWAENSYYGDGYYSYWHVYWPCGDRSVFQTAKPNGLVIPTVNYTFGAGIPITEAGGILGFPNSVPVEDLGDALIYVHLPIISGICAISGICGISGISGTTGVLSGICGTSGFSGRSATAGKSGVSGASGISGISGTSQYLFSGISGTSGYSAFSGTSGLSGFSGTPPIPASAVSGFSGFSGVSGVSNIMSGFSGFSGASAFSGAIGASGQSGSLVSFCPPSPSPPASPSQGSYLSGWSGRCGKSGISGIHSGRSGISGWSACPPSRSTASPCPPSPCPPSPSPPSPCPPSAQNSCNACDPAIPDILHTVISGCGGALAFANGNHTLDWSLSCTWKKTVTPGNTDIQIEWNIIGLRWEVRIRDFGAGDCAKTWESDLGHSCDPWNGTYSPKACSDVNCGGACDASSAATCSVTN